MGIDFDSSKCALARRFGAETVDLSKSEDPLAKADLFSRGAGVDAVIITAATKSNDPVSNGAKMCRKRGRIVLVGVVGLELSRDDFYEKEISFQVSCSYGPGRYDDKYEEKGHDYPIGFVRWTEQRNFEAVLDLMSSGALIMEPLISHRFEIEEAISAYKCLDDQASLGILLNYSSDANELLANKTVNFRGPVSYKEEEAICGFVGGGKKKAEADEAKAAAAAEDEKGTTYGFVTAVTELHGAMKEVERRRDVERDRRERRGESQLVAVKPHARDAAGAPMVEKYVSRIHHHLHLTPPTSLLQATRWWRSTRARSSARTACARSSARGRAARTCSACSRIGSAPPK